MSNRINRRSFLVMSAAWAYGMGISGAATSVVRENFYYVQQKAQQDGIAVEGEELPVVTLGRTGRVLPRLGFGGFPVCRLKSDNEAVTVIRKAIDLGVRYIDTAPSYCAGVSEKRIGKALAGCGIDREEFFVATKTLRRDAIGAREELEESLGRLGLEYVNSVQVHAVHSDYESLFGENAVLKGLEKAKSEGLIKHIGITAHANPQYLIKAVRKYEFDTALVPINPWDTKHMSFVKEFLPVAVELGIGVVAMKVYAGGALFKEMGKFSAGELLQYALSQEGVAVVVPGCDKIEYVEQAFKAAVDFKEVMSKEKQAELVERTGEHLGKSSEWYKDDK